MPKETNHTTFLQSEFEIFKLQIKKPFNEKKNLPASFSPSAKRDAWVC